MVQVHQFHAGSANGDGVTNAMLFTQKLLRDMGFESEVFCAQVDPALAGRLHPVSDFPNRPDDILLLHHSHGHDLDAWVSDLKSRVVLVYHNITPRDLLPGEGKDRHYADLGRQQLRAWRERVAAAVADSPFNARELAELGYADVRVLPLLVDLETIRSAEVESEVLQARRADPAYHLLFVGRLLPHKRQDLVVRTFASLRPRLDRPARLLLVGHLGDRAFCDRLHALSRELGVADAVEMTGPVSAERLRAEYRGCDAFCCLSAHEGFGMPLIEAMASELPVVAADAGNIADTLGRGGLLAREPDPDRVAAALALLESEPELRRRVLRAQRANLERFERSRLEPELARLLADLGVTARPSVPPRAAAGGAPPPLDIRIEGPFDTDYSLAIVNRELARALSTAGTRVGLVAMDGPGRYRPDPAFLARDRDMAPLAAAGEAGGPAAAVLRNCYPPRVEDMEGQTLGLANYAWEESGFPADRVAAFNRCLNLITVTSHYVARVLIDNGVRVPIAVVGNGVDHLRGIAPVPPRRALGRGRFRVLHVSSGFPRKGVDVLLRAWGEAFGADDDVSLVIKTFPNEHNVVWDELAALAERRPDHAEVVVIDDQLDEAELAGLYAACHAFVAPTRGEGFGLPMAEAALFGLPVIATAYSGQCDFCTPDTAWLVDYRFARSRSHLATADSVWAEPDAGDLARCLQEVRDAPQAERDRRAAALRDRLLARYPWSAVAARTQASLAALDDLPTPAGPQRVAWITSWNARCGIASYARFLASRFAPDEYVVLASRAPETLEPDGDNVRRCWDANWQDDLDDLYAAVREAGVQAAVIQFNFGFFRLDAFGRLLQRLRGDGIATFVVLHSTADVDKPDFKASLSEIPEALSGATRLLVHGLDDLNRLKDFGHVENVTLFPHGVTVPDRVDPAALRARYGLGDGPVLASFGFLLPHKGLEELVAAFEMLRDSHPDLRLLLLNARYPVPASEKAQGELEARIAASAHRDAITLVTDYLPDEEAIGALSLADAIVYPYQTTLESSSAAARFGLASGRPVACSPLPIFDDVAEVTHRLPGTAPEAVAEGVGRLLRDSELRQDLMRRQAEWLAPRRWDRVSERLWNMLQAETRPWRRDWLDLDAACGPGRPVTSRRPSISEAAQ